MTAQLQAHKVTPEELERLSECSSASDRDTLAEVRKALTGQETGSEWPCIRFTYGDVAKHQYTELRSCGPKDDREVSLVSIQQDGKKRFNVLLKSDGNRNWVTPEELKRFSEFMERASASETALEAKVAELTEQLKELQARYESLLQNPKSNV